MGATWFRQDADVPKGTPRTHVGLVNHRVNQLDESKVESLASRQSAAFLASFVAGTMATCYEDLRLAA